MGLNLTKANVIAGPIEVWYGPVGEALPDFDDLAPPSITCPTPSGNWVQVGCTMDDTLIEPKVEKQQERETAVEASREPEGVILIVDDEAMIRNSVRRLLEKMGYVVLTASSGKEALEILSEKKSEIALVILDLIMPEMDGTETFYALRNIDADVRILLSSGYSKDSKVEKLLKGGATGFVPKPFDLKGLSDSITKAFE